MGYQPQSLQGSILRPGMARKKERLKSSCPLHRQGTHCRPRKAGICRPRTCRTRPYQQWAGRCQGCTWSAACCPWVRESLAWRACNLQQSQGQSHLSMCPARMAAAHWHPRGSTIRAHSHRTPAHPRWLGTCRRRICHRRRRPKRPQQSRRSSLCSRLGRSSRGSGWPAPEGTPGTLRC
jgi:hypothetical protein